MRVLLRGGLRAAELCPGVVDCAGGDGVGDTIEPSGVCMVGGAVGDGGSGGLRPEWVG